MTVDFETSVTQAGDRAIKDMIAFSAGRILDGLGRGRLKAMILTGAMTMGEGTVRVRPDGTITILSDLDLYLVVAPGVPLADMKRRASETARALRAEVPEARVASSFDLAAVSQRELTDAEPAIGTIDLRNRGRVIWGEDVLAALPPLDPASIPARDAVTLIHNRIVEELLYGPPAQAGSDEMTLYHSAKTGADMALAVLVLLGEYRPTYRERAERLREVWGGPALEWLRRRDPAFPERVEACSAYKIAGDPARLHPLVGDADGATAPRRLWSALIPTVESVWTWAVRRSTQTDEEDPLRLVERMGKTETRREKLRGWRAARRRGDLGWGPRSLWRAARGVTRGSPLLRMYAAGSLIYFGSPARNGALPGPEARAAYLKHARQLIPFAPPSGTRAVDETERWESARKTVVDYWKRVVMRGMR